ncbi:MAG: GatB/YqeY domain-containing protein, partial [Acidimicrobiia bacterium]
MSDSTGTIKQQLQADLTAEMKARDEVATSTIRMLRSAITNAEVAGDAAVELSDDQVIAVLQGEAKKRAESAEVYEQNGRTESAAKERAELAVI